MPGLQAAADTLRLMSDPTRLRLLAVIAEEELTVAELTRITRISQSRVSTHLGKLREARLVRDRRAGTSVFYSLNESDMPPDARRLWETLRETTFDPLIEDDLRRLTEVVRARSKDWASAVAGSMHLVYSPGRIWEGAARALLGLAQLGDVIDIASGDGVLAELVAPRAHSVVCVDANERVVGAGRERLKSLSHVRFIEGDMHALPVADASFDNALLMNALTYARAPEQVLREVARVLTPGGALVGTTLRRHRHEDAVKQYNHVSLGFEPDELRALCENAGLEVELCALTCRERQAPYFEIITLHARRRARAERKKTRA